MPFRNRLGRARVVLHPCLMATGKSLEASKGDKTVCASEVFYPVEESLLTAWTLTLLNDNFMQTNRQPANEQLPISFVYWLFEAYIPGIGWKCVSQPFSSTKY